MTTLVVDGDMIAYKAASICEKRSITVTHISKGTQKEFDTRTDFWGRDRKHSGGWLSEVNKDRKKPFLPEEFKIEDVQTAQSKQSAFKVVKNMIENLSDELLIKDYRIYLGKGDSFRKDVSTIIEYKGNRKDLLKPLLLEDVRNYLVTKMNAKLVTEKEADDQCVIDCYRTNNILYGEDKDYGGCPVLWFNPNRKEDGIQDCNNLGMLYLDDKNKVRGIGRLFFYFQVLSGDDADNYFANSASDMKWGDKSAYNALVNCKTDREAIQVLSHCYRELYPEKKSVKGWRGNEFDIDWKYVLRENFILARMLRWDGDDVEPYELLNTMGCLTRNEIKEMK